MDHAPFSILAWIVGDISFLTIALCALSVLVASTLQAGAGFGFALVAAPVFVLCDPSLVPGAPVLLALVSCLASAWVHRHAIQFRGLGSAITGRFLGTAIAVPILGMIVGTKLFDVIFGCAVLVAVVLSGGRWRIVPTVRTLFFAGVASGISGTAIGIGGPPMALVFQHSQARIARANLNAFFTLGCVFSVGLLLAYGLIGPEHLRISVMTAPFLGLGILVSKALSGVFDRNLRVIVSGCCAASAGAVLLRAFFAG